jgi:hypothetical protein
VSDIKETQILNVSSATIQFTGDLSKLKEIMEMPFAAKFAMVCIVEKKSPALYVEILS